MVALGLVLLLPAGCRKTTEHAMTVVGQQAAARAASAPPRFERVPAGTLSAARAVQSCSVDTINNGSGRDAALSSVGGALFDGWAAEDGTDGQPPHDIRIVLIGVGSYWVEGHTGLPRPDVAAAYHAPDLADSGFSVPADMYGVPIGQYGVAVAHRGSDGWRVCRTSLQVSVQ